MRLVIYFFSILLLFGLNVGFFGQFPFWGSVPNLCLLWTMFFAAEKHNYDFLFIGLVSGILLDFQLQVFPGSFVVAFLTAGVILHLAMNYFFAIEMGWKSWLATLFFFYFLNLLVLWFYNRIFYSLHFSATGLDFAWLSRQIALEFVATCLLMFVMLPVYEAFKQFVDKYFSFKQSM